MPKTYTYSDKLKYIGTNRDITKLPFNNLTCMDASW